MNQQIMNTTIRNQNVARQNVEFAYNNRSWTYNDIYQAYGRPSTEKVRAWEYCKRACKEVNGYDLIISSKNTFRFSACFKFEADGELCYGYITADYDRYCYADPEAFKALKKAETKAA